MKDVNDNVVPFNGYTKLAIDPDKVLEAAVGNLENVIIIGYDKEGDLYVASSGTDAAELLYLVEGFKIKLLSGDYNT